MTETMMTTGVEGGRDGTTMTGTIVVGGGVGPETTGTTIRGKGRPALTETRESTEEGGLHPRMMTRTVLRLLNLHMNNL